MVIFYSYVSLPEGNLVNFNFTVKFPVSPGQCLAPSYDEAGEDLADAMARLHVPEVKFNFIPKAAGSVDETMLGSNVYIPQGFKPSPRGLTMKPWFI